MNEEHEEYNMSTKTTFRNRDLKITHILSFLHSKCLIAVSFSIFHNLISSHFFVFKKREKYKKDCSYQLLSEFYDRITLQICGFALKFGFVLLTLNMDLFAHTKQIYLK